MGKRVVTGGSHLANVSLSKALFSSTEPIPQVYMRKNPNFEVFNNNIVNTVVIDWTQRQRKASKPGHKPVTRLEISGKTLEIGRT